MSFAKERDARLLIWQTDETDAELVRLYFQVQDEMSCAVRTMRTSFVNEAGYARALTDELIAFYDSRREGSAAQGVRADWQPPYDDGKNPLLYLFAVADSLMQHHPDIFPAMVFVLEPVKVRDDAAWVRWMDDLLSIVAVAPQLAERVRFVVPRIDIAPFAALMHRHRTAVRVVHGKYSMASVPRELLAESGERGPSGEFRRHFVMLTEMIEGGSPARLEELRAAALKVAEREQWFDQCVVVHLIAGAAYLKWRDREKAIDAYRSAASSGTRAVEAGHPAGHKLVANGLFGEASVHLTHKLCALGLLLRARSGVDYGCEGRTDDGRGLADERRVLGAGRGARACAGGRVQCARCGVDGRRADAGEQQSADGGRVDGVAVGGAGPAA